MAARHLLPEQIGHKSRRSFNLYRAALVYRTIIGMRENYDRLVQHGNRLSTKAAHRLISRIENGMTILAYYPPGERDAPSRWTRPDGGPSKKGKRRGLSRLPINWRQALIQACPEGAEYHDALLVLALTGLRPAELQKGALVSITAQGHLVITINGAKVTATAGQPARRIWLRVDNPVAWELREIVEATGDRHRLTVSISDPRAFCDYVRRLSRQLFPVARYVASPYSFRHAFAADQKAQKVSTEALAQMMGHVSERSQQSYGVARQGRQPLSHVVATAATRPVHHTGELQAQPDPIWAPGL
jgi:integrase